jgi:hypothetical protein
MREQKSLVIIFLRTVGEKSPRKHTRTSLLPCSPAKTFYRCSCCRRRLSVSQIQVPMATFRPQGEGVEYVDVVLRFGFHRFYDFNNKC